MSGVSLSRSLTIQFIDTFNRINRHHNNLHLFYDTMEKKETKKIIKKQLHQRLIHGLL